MTEISSARLRVVDVPTLCGVGVYLGKLWKWEIFNGDGVLERSTKNFSNPSAAQEAGAAALHDWRMTAQYFADLDEAERRGGSVFVQMGNLARERLEGKRE